MAEVGKIEGLGECLANFNVYEKGIDNATPAALKAGALVLQRESQLEVPVRFGILKNSAFTRPSGKYEYHIGYSAGYAIFVHAMTHLHHTNGKAKYLTDPAIEKADKITEAIKNLQYFLLDVFSIFDKPKPENMDMQNINPKMNLEGTCNESYAGNLCRIAQRL